MVRMVCSGRLFYSVRANVQVMPTSCLSALITRVSTAHEMSMVREIELFTASRALKISVREFIIPSREKKDGAPS